MKKTIYFNQIFNESNPPSNATCLTYDKDNIAKPIATIPGMFRNTISLYTDDAYLFKSRQELHGKVTADVIPVKKED